MKSTQEWLRGWTVAEADCCTEKSLIATRYNSECELMRRTGEALFGAGALPSLTGTKAPLAFQEGTGGNFAIRSTENPASFLVTVRGAHKGLLTPEHFVEVERVDWNKKRVYIHRDTPTALPSTDSLLVAAVFGAHPSISAWAHFHQPIQTPHSIRMRYPALEENDHEALVALVHFGVRIVNMIDHDLFRKIAPNNSVDAAIIIGEDPEQTFEEAVRFFAE